MKHLLLTTIAAVLVVGCATNPVSRIDLVTSMPWKSRLERDIIYHTVDGIDLKLDVHVPDAWLGEPPWWGDKGKGKRPTLLYIHGGGFIVEDKESRQLRLLPYLARDWVVININYRLAHEAKAPGAVVDCLKALEWVYANAEKYKIDTNRVVVSGDSAGGHLALMTGLLKEGDSLCGGKHVVGQKNKVAAIINWYGITDFTLHAAFKRQLTKKPHDWFDPNDDYGEVTRSLSPVKYVRKGVAPVMTIHGSNDPAVLPIQAELLHEKLREVGVREKLVMIPERKHGNFSDEERVMIFEEIEEFLGACSPEISLD
jgi:acetyl esterase/lipase